MAELTLLGALLIGFLGSTHCLGMCSGLAAATGQGEGGFSRVVTYNLGRLITYAAIGALAGWFGEQLVTLMPQLTVVLRVAAGLLLVAMGLYVSRWWMGLGRLERVGASLWRYIQPMTRQLLPIEHYWQALLLGVMWGLLPCGLVYSTLGWALSAADWRQASLFMLAFGIGTLPAMVGVGLLNTLLMRQLRSENFRSVAGVFIMAMGFWTMVVPLLHGAHSHHGETDTHVVPGEHHH